MYRILIMLLKIAFFLVVIVISVFAQEFQREIDTIPVFIDGKPISRPFAGGVQWPKPTFVDIDNDGDWDLFVGDQDGSIHFYRNLGTVTEPDFAFETENFADIDVGVKCAPTFVDIDDDGDFDLFVGEGFGTISFYRNTGTTTEPNFILVAEDFYGIDVGYGSFPTFADIDNDGDFDLFVGEGAFIWPRYYGGNVNFYRNIGTPTQPNFTLVTKNFADINVQSGGGGGSRPAFADIDHDGDLDLFVGAGEGRILFYQNTGTATESNFTIVTRNFANIDVGWDSAPTFVDIDNDGYFDLFVGENDGNINFYRNTGTAKNPDFKLVTENLAYFLNDVAAHSAPTFADIDNDGDFDLFVGCECTTIHFYRNTGTATNPIFTLETTNFFDILVAGWSVPTFADIDNDGDLDLFMGVGTGRLLFYRNTGTAIDPVFVRSTEFTSHIKHSSHLAPTFADIDNDGDLDLFVRYTEGSAFYLNNGTAASPSFVLIPRKFPSVDVSGLDKPTFVDIDNDRDLDLFVGKGDNTNFLSGGNISFYRNTGTTAEPNLTLETNNFADIHVPSHAGPAFVDIDNDGDLDLFVGEQDGGLHFFRNTMVTNVTFSEGQEIPNNQ